MASRVISILHSEFHPDKGPILIMETGNSSDYVRFSDIQSFIIPSSNLKDRVLTLEKPNFRLICCLRSIEDKKYERNTFLFNVCVLVRHDSYDYSPLVVKLSRYLLSLETHFCFLSNVNERPKVRQLLNSVHEAINKEDVAHIDIGTFTSLHLKVLKLEDDGPDDQTQACREAQTHLVPVILDRSQEICDLSARRLLSEIDGVNTLKHVATRANMDLRMALSAAECLMQCGTICMIPAFQYSNRYMATKDLLVLRSDAERKKEMVFASHRDGAKDLPSFREVFQFLTYFSAGATVEEVVLRLSHSGTAPGGSQSQNVLRRLDERRCVQTAVIRGYLRHIQANLLNVDYTSGRSGEQALELVPTDAVSVETGQCLKDIIESVSTNCCIEVLWR